MNDTTSRDSSYISRPLPKWLLEQKQRNKEKNDTITSQTSIITIKEDNSILYALGTTGISVLLIVVIISFIIIRKNRNPK